MEATKRLGSACTKYLYIHQSTDEYLIREVPRAYTRLPVSGYPVHSQRHWTMAGAIDPTSRRSRDPWEWRLGTDVLIVVSGSRLPIYRLVILPIAQASGAVKNIISKKLGNRSPNLPCIISPGAMLEDEKNKKKMWQLHPRAKCLIWSGRRDDAATTNGLPFSFAHGSLGYLRLEGAGEGVTETPACPRYKVKYLDLNCNKI